MKEMDQDGCLVDMDEGKLADELRAQLHEHNQRVMPRFLRGLEELVSQAQQQADQKADAHEASQLPVLKDYPGHQIKVFMHNPDGTTTEIAGRAAYDLDQLSYTPKIQPGTGAWSALQALGFLPGPDDADTPDEIVLGLDGNVYRNGAIMTADDIEAERIKSRPTSPLRDIAALWPPDADTPIVTEAKE